MARNITVAALIPLTSLIAGLSPAAETVNMTYLHRSRGENLRAVEMKVAPDKGGGTRYTVDDFPSGASGSKVLLVVDAKGKPVEYRSEANESGGFEWKLSFQKDKVVLNRKLPGKSDESYECPVRPGFLPDLNSRPDPYLTQHLLVRAYDFPKGGKQIFDVYDVDDTGKGLVEYQVSLELTDKDGVALPNGKFKAKHLVQLQQSSAKTWYKKHRGSQTDIWVNDEGAILRIYRHREPYELILQNYEKPADLISPSEKAQGYPQPVCKAP